MAEGFSVQSQLTMTSNVPEVVAQMVRGFENVNRLVKDAQTNLRGLVADFAALSSSSRGIGRLISGLEKMAAIRPNGAMLTEMNDMAAATRAMATFSKEMATSQSEMARSAQETAKAYQEIAAANRRAAPPSGLQGAANRGHGHTSLVDAGIGLGMAGDAGTGFLERSLHQAFDVAHIASLLTQDDRMTPALLAQAQAKAAEVARLVPGSTIGSNLELIREGMRNYGDPNEAISSLLPFARAQMTQRLLDLKQGGSGDAGRAMDALFKAIEDLGLDVDRSDPAHPHVAQDKLEEAVRLITQINVGTQGGVGAQQLLAFVKQSRAAGISMSEEGLRNYVGVMQSMTASRSGTALAGFFNQFLVGTMTKNVFDNLQKQGIYDSTAHWAHGRVQDASKHLANPDLAKSDIVSWFQQTITPMLLKQGLLNTAADGALAVSKDAGRQTTGGLLAELAVAMAQILKQRGNVDHTNADPAQHMIDTDPMAKLLEFRSAENELLVQTGQLLTGPALEGVKGLTAALRDLVDWARANPKAAKDIVLVGAGMTVLAKAAGDLAMVVFIGAPLVTGLRALAGAAAPFGAGGPAGAALARLGGAGVGSLGALSLGILGLGAAVLGTIGIIKGITALNEALGLHPGKGNGPGAAPSPSGNYLWDGITNWWHGFNAPQAPNPHPNARGLPVSPGAYQVPDQTIRIQNIVYLDGEVIHQSMQQRRNREVAKPRTGRSGFDPRMNLLYST